MEKIWYLHGLERAAGVIISWRFHFQLRELKTIPKKEEKTIELYSLLRMTEAREMGCSEEELMRQRASLPDSGRHMVEFGIKPGPRNYPFHLGVVSGGKELLQGLFDEWGFKPTEIYWEKGVSHNHYAKDKIYEDFRISLLLMKKVKKTKIIALPTELIDRLSNRYWCCHVWDNTETKNKNFTINFVHPFPRWNGPRFIIMPTLPPKP